MKPGKTIKQMQQEDFCNALSEYKLALKSRNKRDIMLSSLKVHSAQRNNKDRKLVNRVFKEFNKVN